MNDLEKLEIAARLQQMGIGIRSPELAEQAKTLQAFYARGGNRALRRAAARAGRKPR